MRQIINTLGKFTLIRAVLLFLAVIVAVYLTVIVANLGGQLDEIRKAQIRFDIGQTAFGDPSLQSLPPEVVAEMLNEMAEREFLRLGMDRPFFPMRSFEYLWRAMTLELGRAERLSSDAGSRQVRNILMERIPVTLALFGTANLVLFILALFIALFLSRRYGGFLDRLIIALAPSSAAPGWFYGLFLILIFGAVLRVLPWGGLVDAPLPDTSLGYALSVLRHMILPVTAVVLGALFASIYTWRTFFLIYSSEDYVELARAKGLSSRAIDMRYVLRPVLPPILTSFLLVLITMWMGQIVLETVFHWPGLGSVFYQATQMSDVPVILGVIVIYGYLLAATVFVLDFVYAIIDPRVRVGGGAVRH
ncbi:MAG: ABC transporter permease [Chloroflexi bacterium]|nr:ABC transporter permease [Chloroflexota bacterium]